MKMRKVKRPYDVDRISHIPLRADSERLSTSQLNPLIKPYLRHTIAQYRIVVVGHLHLVLRCIETPHQRKEIFSVGTMQHCSVSEPRKRGVDGGRWDVDFSEGTGEVLVCREEMDSMRLRALSETSVEHMYDLRADKVVVVLRQHHFFNKIHTDRE